MGSQHVVTEPDTLKEHTIVDTDIHLSLDVDLVADYLDEPYYSRVTNPSGTAFPMSGWDRNLGGKIPSDRQVKSPADIQETLCNEFGVDYPVLNATSWLPRLPESDLAVNLMQAYDDLLLDKFLDGNDHFHGLATIATQKPDKAAEELDRIGDEDQMIGAYICTTGPDKPLGYSSILRR